MPPTSFKQHSPEPNAAPFLRSMPFKPRILLFLIALLLLTMLDGCVSLGREVGTVDLPDGAPEVGDILADFVRNDERIENFRGGGTFVLESPEFDAIKKFRGSIRFRRPADLYVQGNHRLTNIPVFKMTCVGPEFLMEFPNSKDQSFYQLEGEVYEDVPFSVSPSDVAREMFLSESWGQLKRRETRLVGYDIDSGIATLAVGPRSRPRRLVEAARVNPEHPSWVVVRNIRIGDDGHVIAETQLTGYSVEGETLFPTEVDAWFPTEATRMIFRMRNIKLNTELPEKYFDIRARASELNLVATSDVGRPNGPDPSIGIND